MIPKYFDTITGADIETLVTNAISESRSIEYKQQLPGGTDDEKREFLADVSSFANSGGGDIVYGIVEKRDEAGKTTGIPERAEGLPRITADAEIRRLDEIIRSGIDPRIPGHRIRCIDGLPSGPALLIRIPKSWAGPHMVTFKNLSRFFSRTSAGKYQLDVREIRSAFTASGDLRSRISAFRTDRLGKIIANEGPVPLPESPKIIIHLVPMTIVDIGSQVDLALLSHDPNLAAPIQNNISYDNRYNIDGFLSYNISQLNRHASGYCQVFRSGAFEIVDAGMVQQTDEIKLVASTCVETEMMKAISRYIKTAKQIGVPLPIIVMVTFFGLKGYGMETDSRWGYLRPGHTIDRDILLLPEVLLEDYTSPIQALLRPIFDAFWQSAGHQGCEHYDDQGRWSNTPK